VNDDRAFVQIRIGLGLEGDHSGDALRSGRRENHSHATIELTIVGPRVDLRLIKSEAIAVLGDLARPVLRGCVWLLGGLFFFFCAAATQEEKTAECG